MENRYVKFAWMALVGFVLLVLFFAVLTPAKADDRLRPNTSINELTEDTGAAASGDFLLRYDASANDWVKIDAAGATVAAGVLENVTAANTITASECGKTFCFDSASGFAQTLPVPTLGCKIDFKVCTIETDGTAHTITTNGGSDVLNVAINELEVDTGDDGVWQGDADTITFVSGTGTVGDFVDCESDGTIWFCDGQTRLDGGITLSSS